MQRLIEQNFTGRDELYAAAESLDDEDGGRVCRRLAEHLADHAIYLQQILAANGYVPLEPTDIPELTIRLFDLVKSQKTSKAVIAAAENCEHVVRDAYDDAIDSTENQQLGGLLREQREDVEFGEEVLRAMQHANQASQGDDS